MFPFKSGKNGILNNIYYNGTHSLHRYILAYSTKRFGYEYKTIELNIAYENQLIIEKNRKNLVENSILSGSKRRQNDTFEIVEAELVHNNKNYNATIRLKGDRTIHFRDKDKSS